MAQQSRATLKGYFNSNDQPTESNFADLIDSSPNLSDDTVTGLGAIVKAAGPSVTDLKIGGTAPANASATGTAGTIVFDSGYVYLCTATNTWKRAALSTW